MKIGESEESRYLVCEQYKMLVNKLSTFNVTLEYLRDKTNAVVDLIPNCEMDIFMQACNDWVNNEDSLPTPKQLSFKCFKLTREKQKEEDSVKTRVCCIMKYRKKTNQNLVEFEEDICNKYEPNFPYYNKNQVNFCCDFHYRMIKELKNIDWNGYKGVFTLCKNHVMSYVESEVFMHKYSIADMSTKRRMFESLDDEHRSELKNYYSNYNKKYCLESSLASAFKPIE